ncbi:MAG: hypothetical protein ACP6IP_10440 [Candidatus Njordarchaeia archaeon]
MNDRYFEVQKKIIDIIERWENETAKYGDRKSWKKFIGDVCVRVLRAFIAEELPTGYTVSQPNSYILGFPTEFDLLVVKEGAKTIEYTNAYKPEDVVIGFEIKKEGIYSSKDELREYIERIKQNFDNIRKNYENIGFIYLTISEVTKTRRSGAINYFNETKRFLSPYKAFCLKASRTGELYTDGWKNFINHVKELINTYKKKTA